MMWRVQAASAAAGSTARCARVAGVDRSRCVPAAAPAATKLLPTLPPSCRPSCRCCSHGRRGQRERHGRRGRRRRRRRWCRGGGGSWRHGQPVQRHTAERGLHLRRDAKARQTDPCSAGCRGTRGAERHSSAAAAVAAALASARRAARRLAIVIAAAFASTCRGDCHPGAAQIIEPPGGFADRAGCRVATRALPSHRSAHAAGRRQADCSSRGI